MEIATGILGSGGQADEVASYMADQVQFRAVDKNYIVGDMVDIEKPTEVQKNTSVIAAVGAPALRKELINKWPGRSYSRVISQYSLIDRTSSVGVGSIVAPNVVITTNVEVGDHALLNVGSTINHNSKIGNFATLSPGVRIAGNVEIGDGAFIGIGAVVSNGVKIASGVVIGAGAVVVSDIMEENTVYVGVPARKISKNNGWLREI